MDATVVWLVIWAVLIFAAGPLGAALGFLAGAVFDEPEIGAFVGWIVGLILAVFAIIQTILHIIALVQQLN